MTDNDYIKALEGCWLEGNCEHCLMKKDNKCKAILRQTALDLIKRQKAEIEKIKKDLKHYLDTNEENGVVYLPKFIVKKMVGDV